MVGGNPTEAGWSEMLSSRMGFGSSIRTPSTPRPSGRCPIRSRTDSSMPFVDEFDQFVVVSANAEGTDLLGVDQLDRGVHADPFAGSDRVEARGHHGVASTRPVQDRSRALEYCSTRSWKGHLAHQGSSPSRIGTTCPAAVAWRFCARPDRLIPRPVTPASCHLSSPLYEPSTAAFDGSDSLRKVPAWRDVCR